MITRSRGAKIEDLGISIKKQIDNFQGCKGVVALVTTRETTGLYNYQWFTEIENREAKTNAIIFRKMQKRKRTNAVFLKGKELKRANELWSKGIARFQRDGSIEGLLAYGKKIAGLLIDNTISHIMNSQSEAGKMKPIKHYLQVMKDACYGAGKPRWVKTGQLIKSLVPGSKLFR